MLQNISSRLWTIQFAGWVGLESRQKRRLTVTSLSLVFSNRYNMISCVKIVEPNSILIWFTWSNLHSIKLSGLPSSWARLFFVFVEQSFLDLSRLSVAGGLHVSRDDTSACALRHILYTVLYSIVLYSLKESWWSNSKESCNNTQQTLFHEPTFVDLEKHREINGPTLGQHWEMAWWNWLTCLIGSCSATSLDCEPAT